MGHRQRRLDPTAQLIKNRRIVSSLIRSNIDDTGLCVTVDVYTVENRPKAKRFPCSWRRLPR
jgi:hypothetical protein